MVGVYLGYNAEIPDVAGQQEDVADGMVFALTGCSKIGNTTKSLFQAKTGGLGQVVVGLLTLQVDDGGMSCLEFRCKRVTVANNGIWHETLREGLCRCTIATAEEFRFPEYLQGNIGRREFTVGQNHGIEVGQCVHLHIRCWLSHSFGKIGPCCSTCGNLRWR